MKHQEAKRLYPLKLTSLHMEINCDLGERIQRTAFLVILVRVENTHTTQISFQVSSNVLIYFHTHPNQISLLFCALSLTPNSAATI